MRLLNTLNGLSRRILPARFLKMFPRIVIPFAVGLRFGGLIPPDGYYWRYVAAAVVAWCGLALVTGAITVWQRGRARAAAVGIILITLAYSVSGATIGATVNIAVLLLGLVLLVQFSKPVFKKLT